MTEKYVVVSLFPGAGVDYCEGMFDVYLSVCESLCVFVCLRAYLQNCTSNLHQLSVHIAYSRGSILIWWPCDTLCISIFIDNVILAQLARNRRHEKAYTQSDSTGSITDLTLRRLFRLTHQGVALDCSRV